MRCAKCGAFSARIICENCLKILREPPVGMRFLGEFRVYYFYKYSEISDLIASKHKMHGHFVFEILAKICFEKFAQSFEFGEKISAVALDDNVRSGYSHTAILVKFLRSKEIKPIYGALRAQNNVKYAGKSLKFRQENPRRFKLLKNVNSPVILVDDLVTTGTSMLEAKKVLEKDGIHVLFGLSLADARE